MNGSTASAVPTSCRDCAMAAPLKHMKTETKIVGSSKWRIEENGLQIVVDLVFPLCLRTGFPSLATTGRSFFSAKKEPKNSSLKNFETTDCASVCLFSKFCNATLLADVWSAQVLCLVDVAYIFERLIIAHGLKIANQSTFFNT